MIQILRSFLEQQVRSGKRSTALQPIIQIFLIAILGMLGSFEFGAPLWFLIIILIIIVSIIVLFWISYDHLLRTNPAALRSEKFHITRTAMEHGLAGDDLLEAVLSFEEKQSLPRGPDDEDLS